jgi:hypothetical protein
VLSGRKRLSTTHSLTKALQTFEQRLRLVT